MLPVISEPRAELSKYVPKMVTFNIDPDKIGAVIGKGGSVVKELQSTFEVEIITEDDGRITVCGTDLDKCNGAADVISLIVNGPEVGAFYNAEVTRLMGFGAFAKIAPGVEGLVHISRLDVKRTEKVEDVVNIGDSIMVKCIGITDEGKIDLSRRDALIEIEGLEPENEVEDTPPRKPRRDNNRRRPRRD